MTTQRNFARFGILLLSTVFLSTCAMAKSCLWKVSSKTGTLYLQGSVHVLKAEHYPLAPAIEQAYAKSDALVLEVDMKEMAAPETQQRIMLKAMLPGSKTLQDELAPATYQQLSAKCAEAELPITALEKSKPWFASMTLTLVTMQKMGFDPRHGLDKHFHDKAISDAKPVIGLENIDFQIDLFDRLSESNPDALVAHMLTDLERIEAELADLEKAWSNGDLDALEELIAKGFMDYPDLYQTFILDRNERWLKKLEPLLKQSKTHMVVVGAGHLSGKRGLIELFKQKGYTLEQL